MEKAVSLETAINSRTTYAIPGTARHFGVFDPAGVLVKYSTVESIVKESIKTAGLLGRCPKVYFSLSESWHNIEVALPLGHVLRVPGMLNYKSYFSLGGFVQSLNLLGAAQRRPFAGCVVGGFKPYPPRRRLCFERVVLKLFVGTAKKSYPYGGLKEMTNTDYHTSKRPEGWISGNLPDPQLEGELSLSDVFCQSKNRGERPIKRDDIGQVLWAGYGSTPHWTHRALEDIGVESQMEIRRYCHQGKTVPSWNAEYGLEIYTAFDGGIYRYISWDDHAAAPTHSLQDVDYAPVKKMIRGTESDVECTRIFILERKARMPAHARWIEAGCSTMNMVLQANALGLNVDVQLVDRGRILALIELK